MRRRVRARASSAPHQASFDGERVVAGRASSAPHQGSFDGERARASRRRQVRGFYPLANRATNSGLVSLVRGLSI